MHSFTLHRQLKLPKLIWREQSLCRNRSTSSSISSSDSGSPSTTFLSSSIFPKSTGFSTGAEVPVHFRSRRPGPKGENLGGSRKPIGSTDGSTSEYEYLKSKGRLELTGKFTTFVELINERCWSWIFFLLCFCVWLLGFRVLLLVGV